MYDESTSNGIVSQPTQKVKQEWAAFREYIRRKITKDIYSSCGGIRRSLYGKKKNEFDMLARKADTTSAAYTSKIKLIDVNVPYNNGDVKQTIFLGFFWVTYSTVVQNDTLRNVAEIIVKHSKSAYNNP